MSNLYRATALYVRISKDDEQTGDSNSISNQISILTRYAEEHDYKNVKIFKDDGYTGTNFERPGFREMMSQVKSGLVERIIVKDLSRLGRNYIETGKYIDIEFPRYDVHFIAINENFDSNGGDVFLSAILNLMNELYVMDLSKKQKSAMLARSIKGEHITSNIPYGYKRDPEKKNHWIVDKKAAEVVKIIFEKYIAGEKITSICDYLTEHKYLSPSMHGNKPVRSSNLNDNPCYWSSNSIINIVDRQEYCGDTVNFKTYNENFKSKKKRRRKPDEYSIIPDTQEPIITREQFRLAQERRSSCKRVLSERIVHELDGIVWCGDCNRKLYLNRRISKKNGDYFIYFCDNYKKNNKCSAHYITEKKLISFVADCIECLVEKYKALDKVDFKKFIAKELTDRTSKDMKQLKTRMESIKKELEEISDTEADLYQDKRKGIISPETFSNISHSLDVKADKLRNELGGISNVINMVDDSKESVDVFVSRVGMFKDVLIRENMTFAVQQLIDTIRVFESEPDENENTKITVKISFTGIGTLPFLNSDETATNSDDIITD